MNNPLQLRVKNRSKLVQELPPVRKPSGNLTAYEGPYTPSARQIGFEPTSGSTVNGTGTLASSLQDEIVNKILLKDQSGLNGVGGASATYSSQGAHRKRIVDLSATAQHHNYHQHHANSTNLQH